jgi:predicted CopG family antitoxin
MKLTDELKNKIDAFFDGKSEEELQYIADKYQALQLHKTNVSGSFFDLIEESLKKEAMYFGAMSLKDAEKCQEYINKAEEYINAIDFIRNYR